MQHQAQEKLNELCTTLRERAGLTPPALAKQAGCSTTVIYHCEGRTKPGSSAKAPRKGVSGSQLRKIYQPLCRNKTEWLHLLLVWAMDKTGDDTNPKTLNQTIGNVSADLKDESQGYQEKLAAAALDLNKRDQVILLKTAQNMTAIPAIGQLLDAFFSGIPQAEGAA